MSRRKSDPLRPVTDEEPQWLARISRSHAEPAAHVARAKALLAVAAGHSYTEAAMAAGRRSGDAVSHLVARFNRAGLAALESRRGGGMRPTYTEADRARILHEARAPAGPGSRRHGHLVAVHPEARTAKRAGRLAQGEHLHGPRGVAGRGLALAEEPDVVPHRPGEAPAQDRDRGRDRPGRRGKKN
jgi:transposase